MHLNNLKTFLRFTSGKVITVLLLLVIAHFVFEPFVWRQAPPCPLAVGIPCVGEYKLRIEPAYFFISAAYFYFLVSFVAALYKIHKPFLFVITIVAFLPLSWLIINLAALAR